MVVIEVQNFHRKVDKEDPEETKKDKTKSGGFTFW